MNVRKSDDMNNHVKELTDQLEQGIKDLFESQKYKDYLTTMSKFHNYSYNNILLIFQQRPDARLIAGYNAWKTEHGRQVLKGSRAIKILAPAPYKVKVSRDKIDPSTNKAVLDENGSPVKENVEVQRLAFKTVNVFDVSDTEGKELPSIGTNELSGDIEKYDVFFEALKRTCPVPIEFASINSGAKGYFSHTENKIVINKGMQQTQVIKTALHEIAHQRLHSKASPDPGEGKTRSSKEVEAESVAYTVCRNYGIDTSDYSFAYIASWSKGKEVPELKESLDIIRKTASEFINKIDEHMADILKERTSQLDDKSMAVNLSQEQTNRLENFSVLGSLRTYDETIKNKTASMMKQNKVTERGQER